MNSDYFIQRLREDPQLLTAFQACVNELREEVINSIIGYAPHDDVLRGQGQIRGLDRLKLRVSKLVHPVKAEAEAEDGLPKSENEIWNATMRRQEMLNRRRK